MSFNDWQPDLEILVTPELVIYFVFLHMLAVTSVLLSAIDVWIQCLFFGLFSVTLFKAFSKYVFFSRKRVVKLIWLGQDEERQSNWRLEYFDGCHSHASLHKSSVLTPVILFLVFQTGRKKEKLVLTRRSIGKDNWRRLAVGLRFRRFT